ncbi:hypothetical protein NAP1_11133 [Erythrobacter sp. NAP1]|uniref:hypothetical protein n=1 Tax=Erythrobacter sp. NAP1 TaxID=237727 RepID=UPI00006878BE|nr:hypothetical protein [Erythrobacter sp. NAP1]EAQ28144.1 hypothetical protein NAP1_11133 [Erythrobacter sp. NAP1]
MSIRTIILLGVFGAPYAYLAWYWAECFSTRCLIDGDMIFATMIAAVALPVLLIIFGGALAFCGARKVSEGVKGRNTASVASGGIGASIGYKMLAAGIPGVLVILYFVLDTPEPGRDRLGRICEKTRSGEVCRPDPDADRPSMIEQLNQRKQRGW